MISALFTKEKNSNLISYLKRIFNHYQEDLMYVKRIHELEKIIRHGDMTTVFQPIVNIQTNETFGFEALNRPNNSDLFPTTDQFYDFVGKTDLVFKFERFCRNLSFNRFLERIDNKFNNHQFVLFINIHPYVLLDKNYNFGETRQLLNELNISPENVVFELTEKSAVTDYQEFERVLDHYRNQGYRIAIDDVGSGYNSLKSLVYLKPEFVKIDRTLIQHIDTVEPSQQIVSLIYNFAEQSGTKIIAEGIERMEEIQFLQKIGIHYGQGYAIGRPDIDVKLGTLPK
ncbi:EAL domain-containing protein [Ureibacillus thermophilus]|uniref:EAL domain-containing protein n=1 Tax=Ureibacillus thermophilus TaxID=367743 RepID=A0A4P6UW09_9BACL|nr:EAL domain-containing protein [Ureibacillus thermophilus]QBK25782.1 EAL domain-containing protein [Ureibacillus thermophilus]